MMPLVFLLAATFVAQAAPPANAFDPLTVYDGAWTVHAQHSFSGSPGPDSLVNHCHADEAFYTCEQVVNGKPAALVIFTLSGTPNKFDVDNVLPNGHASSDTDLILSGDHNEHWTFLTNDAPNRPTFRVENTFADADHIHFEMFSTKDGGKTWTKGNEGDDVRVK